METGNVFEGKKISCRSACVYIFLIFFFFVFFLEKSILEIIGDGIINFVILICCDLMKFVDGF